MRDPKRIGPTLDKIRVIWEGNPDLRLGQLLENVLGPSEESLYQIEEDELLRRLQALYK